MAEQEKRRRRAQQPEGGPSRGYVPPAPNRPTPSAPYPPQYYAQQPQQPQQQPAQSWQQPQPYAQPPQSRQYMYNPRPMKPKRGKPWILLLIVPLVVVLIVIAAAVNRRDEQRTAGQPQQQQQQVQPQAQQAGDWQARVAACNETFCPGVYVDGISVGGMTPLEALAVVEDHVKERTSAWSVRLTYGSNYMDITGDEVTFTTNAKAVLQEGWNVGHTGSYEQRWADMQQLEQTPWTGYTDQPVGDPSIIDEKLATVKTLVDRPAKDAYLANVNKDNIAAPFEFADEEFGYVFDPESLRPELYRMLAALESGSREIVPQRIEPAVRKADLMKKYTLRASATTKIHTSSPENRNNNIRHAFSDFINGTRVEPGASFSFNKVVGMRTAERGFFPADEIVSGEMVEGYGGGVCQASTTIYQAAVCAGMKIVTRQPHSEKVKYADLGLDATVYLSKKRSKDFVFRNTTDSDIWIFATVEKDPTEKGKNRLRTRVDIYGEDMGDVWYKMESVITETIEPTGSEVRKDKKGQYVVYKDDPLYLYSEAQPGYKVDVYLTDTRSGIKTYLYTDEYPVKKAIYYEGTKSR